jgi:hypothetical protein
VLAQEAHHPIVLEPTRREYPLNFLLHADLFDERYVPVHLFYLIQTPSGLEQMLAQKTNRRRIGVLKRG